MSTAPPNSSGQRSTTATSESDRSSSSAATGAAAAVAAAEPLLKNLRLYHLKAGSNLDLPFFPTSEYELLHGLVSVWWFEVDFCQSAFGPDSSCQRNACTLIAVLNAAKFLERAELERGGQAASASLKANNNEALGDSQAASRLMPHSVVQQFAESMLLGNRIYCHLEHTGQLPHPYLNIPEAMEATANYIENIEEWQSFVFMEELLSSVFYDHLNDSLNKWWTHENTRANRHTYCHAQHGAASANAAGGPHHICHGRGTRKRSHVCVVLIAESRSVLLTFEQRPARISVYDSHQHSATTGSCIARAPLRNLPELCRWIQSLFADVYHVRPTCFEFSFLHTKQSAYGSNSR